MKRKWIYLLCAVSIILILGLIAWWKVGVKDTTNVDKPKKDDVNYVYGEDPNEGITIDAYAKEDIWENKNYFTNSHQDMNVTYYVTTHLTEKGVYIFAFSDDANVIYETRNGFKYNSHFYFIVAASDKITKYNDGKCKTLKLDASTYTQPTNFMHTTKTRVEGEANSGSTEGLFVETFISWDQLNSEPVDEIKLYSAYMSVANKGQTGTYISNQFASTVPGTYQKFNKDGYVDTSDVTGKLGKSSYGTNKSGGIEYTGEGMDVVGAGVNSAFFDGYSTKFVATAKLYSNYDAENPAFSISSTAKAGIFLALPSNYYQAVQFDLRTKNIGENNVLLSDRLFTTSNYPNADQVRTNSIYKGIDGNYEYLTIKVIKDESLIYYIVNDKLVGYEDLSWLKAKVKVGLYADNSKCIFKDYQFFDCEYDETTLRNEINKYAYMIDYDLFSDDYKIELSEKAVVKGGDLTFDLYCASGYAIDRIYNHKIDITETLKHQGGATYALKNITDNVNLSVKTKELKEYVTLSGTVLDKKDKEQAGATIRISSEQRFNSYIVDTNKKGNYEVKLPPNAKYTITVSATGYRDTTFTVDMKKKNQEKTLTVDNYLVGGEAGDGGLAKYVSNTGAWDMTRESESLVVLDLQDRKSGGNIYFSDVWETNAVINVTISNITDPNIGIYEKDPGAGIAVSNMVDGKKHTSIYNLYQAGYRVRLDGSYNSGSLYYNKTAGTKNLATSSDKIKLTLVRLDTNVYMFIDDKLVYSVNNDYVKGPAAYGFTFDASSTLALQFEDYSILTGNNAINYAKSMLYSKFNYDSSIFSVSNLTKDGYGLYNTTPVISVKGLKDKEVAIVAVDEQKYYVTKKNNSIEHAISNYDKDGMPDVNVQLVGKTTGYQVTGKVDRKSEVVIVDAQGIRALLNTDKSGNYSVFLPNGEYTAYANLEGYITESVEFKVAGGNVAIKKITLKKDILVDKVTLNKIDIWSRNSSYIRHFNEKTGRYSLNVDQNGNGGAVYLDEGSLGKNVLVKYSFEIHNTGEKNPGIGVWVATTGSPDVHNSVRFTFNGNKVSVRNMVTNQQATWESKVMDGYNISEKKGVYDAAFVRKGNTYYVYLKTREEANYSLVATFNYGTVPGDAAYGFTVTTSSPLEAEIFDYSYSTNLSAINTFMKGAK